MTESFIRIKAGDPDVAYLNVRYVERVYVAEDPEAGVDGQSLYSVMAALSPDRPSNYASVLTLKDGFLDEERATNYIRSVLHV